MRTASALFLTVALFALASAEPVTVELPAVADTFVRSAVPDANYGGAGGLAVSGSEAVNAAGTQMGLYDTFIRFSTADIAQQLDSQIGAGRWHITGVQLRLMEQGAPKNSIFNRGVGDIEARWIANDSWIEGTGSPKGTTTDGLVYNDEPTVLDSAVDVSLGTFTNNGANGTLIAELNSASVLGQDVQSGGDISLFLTAASPSVGFTFDCRTLTSPVLVLTANEKAWQIAGDANLDCRVNIIDLIFVRNRLNGDTTSGDNWQADVNEDGKINIIDLIYVRNRLNDQCVQ